MRRLALVPFVLYLGCWDFEALNSKTVDPSGDGGFTPDLTGCTRSVLAEICDNGVDDNDDCLTDCQDPMCQGDKACLQGPLTPQYVGPGSLEAATMSCGGKTDLVSGPTLSNKCTGCACGATATSKLTAFSDNMCKTKIGNDQVLTSDATAAKCFDLTAGIGAGIATGSKFILEETTVTCAPNATAAKIDNTTWGQSAAFCPTTVTQACDSFLCLKQAGVKCVEFKGDVACPSAFPKSSSWLDLSTVMDARTCNCGCNPASTKYTPATNDMKLSDDKACGGTSADFSAKIGQCNDNPVTGKVPAGFSFTAKSSCAPTSNPGTDASKVTGQKMTVCCAS